MSEPHANGYQLLPALRPEEFAALKRDIAERGVLVPVELDEQGAVLDGHHRHAIAAELGIDCPTIVRRGLSEPEKREHVFRLNLLRRQLGPISWAEAFKRLCEVRGVDLGQGARNDKTSATVAEVAQELGVPERTARHRLQVADELGAHPEVAQAVDRGDISVHEARWHLRDDCRAALKAKPVPPPQGQYATIVADPPWEAHAISRYLRPQETGFSYPSMSAQELVDFGATVSQVAAPNCHLYVWATHKQLPFAFELVKSWGFSYECLLTWVKNVGFTPFSWMYTTEHVLFCHRGKPRLLQLGLPTYFAAKTTGHSVKPEAFFELVRKASPEPRLELFARKPHDGFVPWGNEVSA